MFNKLIESKPQKPKMAGGTLFSLVFHGTLVAAAFTMIVGGVMGVAILLRHRGLGQLARRYFTTFNYLMVTGTLNHDGPREGEAAARRFPYALAIGFGTLWAILWLHQ